MKPNPNPSIFHSRAKDKRTGEILNHGGFTFAYQYVDSSNQASDHFVIGISKCNEEDRYVRKAGRELALARLAEESHPLKALISVDDVLIDVAVNHMIEVAGSDLSAQYFVQPWDVCFPFEADLSQVTVFAVEEALENLVADYLKSGESMGIV